MEFPYAVTLTPDYILGVEKNQFVRIPVATDITGGTPLNESRNILTGTQSTPGGAITLPAAVTFSGAVTLSPASANVVLSPTGTGVVTIAPATAGTINNCSIGATTRSTGAFTQVAITRTDSTGTPGNVTNNSALGRAAIAAAATTCVVTNSLVTANSEVFVEMISNDTTLTSIRVTVAAGSFTVTGNAAATAATSFRFLVLN
jgi:hypothetical protein